MITQIPPDLSRECVGGGSPRGPEIRLETILAPVDFSTASQRGLTFALDVAKRFHATIRLLHIVEPPSLPQWGYAHVPMHEAKLLGEAREGLGRLKDTCNVGEEIIKQTEVRTGGAAASICEAAQDEAVDLIIMPAHRHSFLGRLLLGSVTQRVARCAPCPVLVIRDRVIKAPEGRKDFAVKRIVVPTDFSNASKKAFPYATALARKFGATITLLYVAPTHLALGLSQVGVVLEEKRLIEQAREELPRFREASLDPHVQVATVVLSGGATHEICQFAQKDGADLIVMSTHGHTAFQRFMLGSVTEHVLREAPCPVLIVREREHEFLVSQS
ncbi:MAG: universal stress protein [Verrucomicrobia subdivision 3 bacterium]|nr:universal stress protein [Limisphaerales bacterium]